MRPISIVALKDKRRGNLYLKFSLILSPEMWIKWQGRAKSIVELIVDL
jgi:hypothetical protein